ncbi:major facilitator superfamily domain-containing protein [Mycena maculata]|uniref:Major facilitator superfamily domain-containing protein n=1 Tax=Mycena maculata TaxID=230809 RepID=A0AAD7NDU9_9AGAR|nr:major facilitator superfamily domain-containing protein [Mycena maculata]
MSLPLIYGLSDPVVLLNLNHTMSTASPLPAASSSEREPLLSSDAGQLHNTRWKANPYWAIPIILIVNIARGMTLSPRIKVYNEIACRAVGSSDNLIGAFLMAQDCGSSQVRARASKIQASLLTIMSILSSVSTGLWSQWGDIRGRKIIFCVSLVGFIAMEFIFVLVSSSISAITVREEVFLMIGPVLEGMCGGLSVFNGVVHAYISDCTPDGSRSRIFSAVQGMVFIGLAIGPWIGGILLSSTDLGPYSLFYISIAIQLILLVYIVFFFPESLRSKVQQSSRADVELASIPSSTSEALRNLIQRFIVALISPIAIFRPRTVTHGTSTKKDYNLTLLGAAMLLYIISTAVYQLKYLYGQHTYAWDSAQLGYYMSLLWISRAINLLILLPVIVSYFKPKTAITGASSPESIALELQFDRRLAQASLSLDAFADLLVAISPASSQAPFIVFSCLSSFASGGNPALHSLGAVCIYALGHGSETGRLFGAIGVLSAISHSISPTIFAMTYSLSVSYYPRAIFCVAAGLLLTSVIFLGRIRAKVGIV